MYHNMTYSTVYYFYNTAKEHIELCIFAGKSQSKSLSEKCISHIKDNIL